MPSNRTSFLLIVGRLMLTVFTDNNEFDLISERLDSSWSHSSWFWSDLGLNAKDFDYSYYITFSSMEKAAEYYFIQEVCSLIDHLSAHISS
jgi:hypothetical protein